MTITLDGKEYNSCLTCPARDLCQMADRVREGVALVIDVAQNLEIGIDGAIDLFQGAYDGSKDNTVISGFSDEAVEETRDMIGHGMAVLHEIKEFQEKAGINLFNRLGSQEE